MGLVVPQHHWDRQGEDPAAKLSPGKSDEPAKNRSQVGNYHRVPVVWTAASIGAACSTRQGLSTGILPAGVDGQARRFLHWCGSVHPRAAALTHTRGQQGAWTT